MVIKERLQGHGDAVGAPEAGAPAWKLRRFQNAGHHKGQ